MSGHDATYEPGQMVIHPDRPDWGQGQVQSVAGARVTVNFPNAGKILMNTEQISLQVVAQATPPA